MKSAENSVSCGEVSNPQFETLHRTIDQLCFAVCAKPAKPYTDEHKGIVYALVTAGNNFN